MKTLKAAIFAIVGIGCAALAACANGPASAEPQAVSAASPGSLNGYRLGTGDEIKITVFGEKDLSGPFVVDGLGAITMSLIGQVEVKGLTLADTQKVIETKLADGWLREPKVTAELSKGRPYYILGEVNKAGEYPFTSGLTVMNAIAAAGDFTYRANKRKIMIKSFDSPVEREVELTPTTMVQPGDTIRIRERFF
jgi:polysaccharide export outer membrane protein